MISEYLIKAALFRPTPGTLDMPMYEGHHPQSGLFNPTKIEWKDLRKAGILSADLRKLPFRYFLNNAQVINKQMRDRISKANISPEAKETALKAWNGVLYGKPSLKNGVLTGFEGPRYNAKSTDDLKFEDGRPLNLEWSIFNTRPEKWLTV